MIKKMDEKCVIGKLYFCYLALVLLPQILGVSAKGTLFDTAWKAATIVGTLWYAYRKTNGKIRKYMVLPIILYGIGQMLALMPNGGDIKSSIINVFVVLAMSYLFLSVSTSRADACFLDINFFCNAFICLMLYAVVYNTIKNPTAVFEFLSVSSVYSNMMSSFFDNKQTFGMFLFMALIASTWQYLLTKKKMYLLSNIIFLLNIFICLSRTALLACGVYIIAVIILTLFADRALSKFFIGTVVIGVTAIYVYEPLRDFVLNVLFDTDRTMNARTNIWENAFAALQGTKLWIGYGEGNAASAIKSVLGYGANSHNGIVQILLTGGLLKLGLYIIVLLYSVKCSLDVRRYNKTLAYLFIATIVSVFAYSMGEALVLLDTSAPCIVASIMCIAFPVRVRTYYLHRRLTV